MASGRASVRSKMVLKGPALRGIFAVCYLKGVGAGAPVAFNFTDAWGLAFLLGVIVGHHFSTVCPW